MDPAVREEFRFAEREEDHSVEREEDLETRLRGAAIRAENLLKDVIIHPAIEITRERHCSIIVRTAIEDGVEYLYIHRNIDGSERSPYTRIPHDSYRYLYFDELVGCRIFIKSKLLRCMFRCCTECQISIREPIIGMVECFKCKQTNIVIRVKSFESSKSFHESAPDSRSQESGISELCSTREFPHSEGTIPTPEISNSLRESGIFDSPIPFVRIEECKGIYIYQSNDRSMYIIKSSPSVTGTIINGETGERQQTYSLGSMRWQHPSKQNLVYLSRDEGFASVPLSYPLNNISGYIHLHQEDRVEDDTTNDFIVGTPPF
jgi:hypothetical protein